MEKQKYKNKKFLAQKLYFYSQWFIKLQHSIFMCDKINKKVVEKIKLKISCFQPLDKDTQN